MQPQRRDITGVILAGGRGRRVGGQDKGLVPYNGRPLIEHVIERFAPQVGTLLISANRNADRYSAYGHVLVGDRFPDFAGPLAGIDAALAVCATPWLVCVPCDAPHLPVDLVAGLAAATHERRASAVFAATPQRDHPTFLLLESILAPRLEEDLRRGAQRLTEWCQNVGAARLEFPDEAAFDNFNTPADFAPPTR